MSRSPLCHFRAAFHAATCLLTAAAFSPATAHEAKSGWLYPADCCSDRDCREVAANLISEKPEGYVIELNGERLAYSDKRIRRSPDGVYHWCSAQGRDDTRTICLFVPPHSF